jgi:hypothetical protein
LFCLLGIGDRDNIGDRDSGLGPGPTPLPVSLSSSQEVATPWVIVPDADSTWLKNQERYAGDSSDLKDRRRLGPLRFPLLSRRSVASEMAICQEP